MKIALAGVIALAVFVMTENKLLAQGFTEYSRGLQGVVRNRGGVSRNGLGRSNIDGRGTGYGGVLGDDSQPVPSTLTVASKEASLYARQDAESDTVVLLSRGDRLVPMAQTVGGSSVWYMVRTEKGAVGWIKSSDVSEQAQKKP